jgi:hypothetical protein
MGELNLRRGGQRANQISPIWLGAPGARLSHRLDLNGCENANRQEAVREFRYEWAVGGARERYLTIDGNPNAPNADPNHPETYGLIEPVRRGL